MEFLNSKTLLHKWKRSGYNGNYMIGIRSLICFEKQVCFDVSIFCEDLVLISFGIETKVHGFDLICLLLEGKIGIEILLKRCHRQNWIVISLCHRE